MWMWRRTKISNKMKIRVWGVVFADTVTQPSILIDNTQPKNPKNIRKINDIADNNLQILI